VVSRAEVPAILVIVSTSVNGRLGMLCATSGSKRRCGTNGMVRVARSVPPFPNNMGEPNP